MSLACMKVSYLPTANGVVGVVNLVMPSSFIVCARKTTIYFEVCLNIEQDGW